MSPSPFQGLAGDFSIVFPSSPGYTNFPAESISCVKNGDRLAAKDTKDSKDNNDNMDNMDRMDRQHQVL